MSSSPQPDSGVPEPRIHLNTPGATPEEAAALVAAVEQFLREHAPVLVEPAPAGPSPWQAAALEEGVRRPPQVAPFWS